ncbi:MAG: hypothetical protein ACOH1Y_10100 [Propionicimonas sp.]
MNISTMQGLLVSLGGLAVILLGVSIVAAAKKAKNSEVAQTALNGVVGIIFIAIGAGAVALVAWGKSLMTMLGIG